MMVMLKWKLGLMIVLVLGGCPLLKAQELPVTGSWRVSFEDKSDFSKPGWNDTGWEELKTLKWSDDHKTTANRTLWIRKTIVIPSGMKAAYDKTGMLSLSMGKIQQSDDTYLNGKLIGSTGSGDTYRNYIVKKEDILWDSVNVLSIRVRHWGSFGMSKIPTFAASLPAHFLTIASGLENADPKAPVLSKNLHYQLSVTNKSPREFESMVKADFYNFEGTLLFSEQKKLLCKSTTTTADFPFTSTSPFVKIVFSVAVPEYNYSTRWNAEYGYENVAYKEIPALIQYKAAQRYSPPPLAQQTVKGWLGDRLNANTEQRLKKVDENALLAGFINRPGSHSWIGEHVGKFLEAACNAYANNQDPALKIQIDRTAQQLMAAQLPDGYLGTYDMDSHWTSWDVWSHRYDLMGLLRYYELSGFKPALTSCEKIGDLLLKTFGTQPGQRNILTAGGHVGMAATCILESMEELYRFSGNTKYLDFCYYVVKSFDAPNGPRIISTLDSVQRVDKVANGKAYEMLSNILGIIKLYRITGDQQFLKPVLAAWKDIVKNRLYITGTSSSFEHFQDDDVLPAEKTVNMGEGCVTTTWVQLNYQLLCISGDIKYLDELERSVYNHLTGAENPETGCVSYYTPLMGAKPYGCGITCCMSSVPRGIAMIPLFASGKIDNIPSFLFYQPGNFSLPLAKNQMASFTTETNFPNDGNIIIRVDASPATAYAVQFRKPYWAREFAVWVNGKKQALSSGDFVSVNRVWKKGDQVAVAFTMPLVVLQGGKSYPGQVAFQRGPQVLSFDERLNGYSADSLRIDPVTASIKAVQSFLPVNWVGAAAFELETANKTTGKKALLVPYADASQTGGVVTTWINKEMK